MTTPDFYCPWCEEQLYGKACVHVKELESTEYGFRVVFRDLHDMPIKTVLSHFSLNDLKSAPPADYLLHPADYDEQGRPRKGLGK